MGDKGRGSREREEHGRKTEPRVRGDKKGNVRGTRRKRGHRGWGGTSDRGGDGCIGGNKGAGGGGRGVRGVGRKDRNSLGILPYKGQTRRPGRARVMKGTRDGGRSKENERGTGKGEGRGEGGHTQLCGRGRTGNQKPEEGGWEKRARHGAPGIDGAWDGQGGRTPDVKQKGEKGRGEASTWPEAGKGLPTTGSVRGKSGVKRGAKTTEGVAAEPGEKSRE
ncbi:hypothetical protein Tco_1375896 [Tanacetum coccineum]